MKKSIAIVLIMILITGIFPYDNVYGQKNFEKNLEDITNKIKNMLDITYEYENFDSELSTYDDTIRYYLNWNDKDKEIPDINVEVDENMNIISYFKSYKTGKDDKSSSISIKEAEDLALRFIKQVSGENLKEISKAQIGNSSPWDNSYSFEFYRQVEGIPFYGDMIRISIDRYRGEIQSYNSNWDYDIEFPDKKKAIEIEKAKEILKEKLGLELIYKLKYNGYPRRADNPEFYLTYGFLNDSKAIDAITGEVIPINRYGRVYGGFGADSVKEESTMDSGLTPKEKEEIEKLSGINTKDEIEKISREILQLNKEYKLINSSLYSSWKNKDQFLWNLYFEIGGEEYNGANISLDAKTNEIVNFYKYQDHKDKKSIIDKDQAFKIAKEYLNKMASKKISQVEYIEDSFTENNKDFNFTFIRKQDDIYVEDDYISIGVSSIDKSVVSYSVNWYNGKILLKDDIINLEEAYEILFDQIGYELMYVKTYVMNTKLGDPSHNKPQLKLIYDTPPNNPKSIDAINGKLLNYSGDEYIPDKEIKYTDLENSYAKDKIKALGEYGIGFDEEKFKPKEEIVQKDFVYLLWRSINPYREKTKDIDKIYEELINSGIIKEHEKSIDEPVTKEESVAFIIRAMNYEEIANLKDIYKNIFIDTKDIKEEYIGHINLAYGFKIIQGDGSNPPRLNPKKKLTREDAGNIIYNYIFR